MSLISDRTNSRGSRYRAEFSLSKSSSEIMTHSSVGDIKDIKLSWRRFGVGLDLHGLGSPNHSFESLRGLVVGAESQ